MAEELQSTQNVAEPARGQATPQPVARISPRALESAWAWLRAHADALAEVAVIGLWAAWVGRAYLNLDPAVWPTGREMGAQILTHHFWTQLWSCGVCALWNGSVNGGSPALADIFGSTLHPLVMLTTLIWGTVNGAKLALVGALGLAGLAQWWIARTLGLGRTARVWSALLGVVGGHLTGRMENSNFGLVVSTAACSLALAAALHLGVTGQRRATVLLALTGAMAIVSGQGYLQLSLVFWVPAFLFFIMDEELRLRPLWREYALAVGLSLLLAGAYLVPVLHFFPNIYKETNPAFTTAQPLEYIPLNLVIRDGNFMRAEVLGKLPFPYMYNLYIGWVPVLLAGLCLLLARRADYPALFCLGSGVLLTFFVASAIPLLWLVKVVPEFSGFRHIALTAGLAIPALLGLAAYGLDRVLALNWPQVVLRFRANASADIPALSLAWILALPLGMALYAVYALGQIYLATTNVQPIYGVIGALRTPSLQWVAAPFGEHFWIEPALTEGLKLTNVVWAWGWKDHPVPEPRWIANRPGPPPDTEVIGQLDDIPIYQNPNVEYAYVESDDETTPCQATGSGGFLQVACETSAPGQLSVMENRWTGWQAWQDGRRVLLLADRWLTVDAPAGKHTYLFRYLPWDVPLGVGLTLVGLVVCARLWRRDRDVSAHVAA